MIPQYVNVLIRAGLCYILITIDTGSFTLLQILKSRPTLDISGSPITNYLPLKLREYCQALSTLLSIKLNWPSGCSSNLAFWYINTKCYYHRLLVKTNKQTDKTTTTKRTKNFLVTSKNKIGLWDKAWFYINVERDISISLRLCGKPLKAHQWDTGCSLGIIVINHIYAYLNGVKLNGPLPFCLKLSYFFGTIEIAFHVSEVLWTFWGTQESNLSYKFWKTFPCTPAALSWLYIPRWVKYHHSHSYSFAISFFFSHMSEYCHLYL